MSMFSWLMSHPVVLFLVAFLFIGVYCAIPSLIRSWKANSWSYYRLTFKEHRYAFVYRVNRLGEWQYRNDNDSRWVRVTEPSQTITCNHMWRIELYFPLRGCVRPLSGQVVSNLVRGFGWCVMEQATCVPCDANTAAAAAVRSHFLEAA